MNLPIVCLAKAVRTMGFGAVSVVLALFLIERGLSAPEVGVILSLTLLEDALVTTLASMCANRLGMRFVLLLSTAAILIGGCVLAFGHDKWLVALAVTFGIVSPSGYEGGPFAPIEQTIISQSVSREKLASAFSWYNLVGFGGAALGALLAGGVVALAHAWPAVQAYQSIFLLYALSSFVLAVLYLSLNIIENAAPAQGEARQALSFYENFLWQRQSCKNIRNLAGLQALDAFGGGFVVQSIFACWFYQRYHVDAAFLGPVFFGTNVIAALSFIAAPYVVKRMGLLNAMVFTHLPCSLALFLLPFLPSAGWAAALLLVRSGFSSLDIPARQAYTMLIVPEAERPAAAGLTTSARAVAQGLAPTLTGLLMNGAVTGTPILLAGFFKSIYDVSLYCAFRHVPLHADRVECAPHMESVCGASAERSLERVR